MFLLRMSQKSYLWSEFKRNQMNRISSTEMSSVLHCNPRMSYKKLFLLKSKREKNFPVFSSSAVLPIEHGMLFEPIARSKIFEKMKSDWDLKLPGCVLDPSAPLCCSPDGVFFHKTFDKMLGLEIKCPFLPRNMPVTKHDIKTCYLIQCFVCLHVCRADGWMLVFYDAESNRLESFEISPDSSLWKEVFLSESSRFVDLLADNDGHVPPKKNKKDKIKENVIRTRLLSKTKPFHLPL